MADQSNTLEKKYLHDTVHLNTLSPGLSGHVRWECPSNIALIKYWGKRPVQLPLNPSFSFTLMNSVTSTRVDYAVRKDNEPVSLDFTMEHQFNPQFGDKVKRYLQQVALFMPFLNRLHLKVQTLNTFPHSAGIASSASSFGALALILCSMEQELFGTLGNKNDFFQKSSFIARLGSGSACRSIFGGYALWGFSESFDGSSDEAAIPMTHAIHEIFMNYRDSILVVHSGPKAFSSSAGHSLMELHPFASARFIQAQHNLERIWTVLKSGEVHKFIEIVENEALSLHSLMLSSDPGVILLYPDTIEIINKIRQYRKSTGNPVCFTLDAGANVHVLYPAYMESEIRLFIENDLKEFCEANTVIHDCVGRGPVKLNTHEHAENS